MSSTDGASGNGGGGGASGVRQVSDDVKRIGLEKIANIKVFQLFLMVQIIDLAMARGAFRGAEASQIGILYDTLITGINKAFELAEEDLKKVSETVVNGAVEDITNKTSKVKLEVINEDEEERLK